MSQREQIHATGNEAHDPLRGNPPAGRPDWDVEDAHREAAQPDPASSGAGALESTVRVLKARKWLILAGALLGVIVGLVFSLQDGDRYESTATLLFAEPASASFTGAQATSNDDPQRLAATRSELLSLQVVAAAAARSLGGGVTPKQISDAVEVKSRTDADVVDVKTTGDSAKDVARYANAYAAASVTLRRRADRASLSLGISRLRDQLSRLNQQDLNGDTGRSLRQRIDDLVAAVPLQTGNAEVVQRARVPQDPIDRHLVRNGLLGGAIATILAMLLAAGLERLDRRVKTVEELEDIYGLPVVARIPRSRGLSRRSKGHRDSEILSTASGFSEEAEAFRALRANLRYLNVDHDMRSLLIASPTPGDGKSTIARYLAITMASMGDRVVLVDADLRKLDDNSPAVHATGEGLSLVLAGFDLDEALTEVLVAFDPVSEQSRALVELSSGPLPPNPAELLESDRMVWVIRELESRFDRVIIDSPAIASVSDALALVPHVSGALVISGVNKTTRNAALGLHKQLGLLRGNAVGVVANFWDPEGERYHYYRYE